MSRILVIEDDQRIRELVCKHLAEEGHLVTSQSSGLEGLRAITESEPEVIILDLGLPDLDGLDLLKMARSVTEIPVLVLTAREDEETILKAFSVGADDYVVKPVSGPQLSARVEALMRRSKNESSETITIGDLELLLGPRQANFKGDQLKLTAKEFDVLSYLAVRKGTVVSKEELLD